ncbi:MAG: protein translocase subunit SecD [bacterium]|jgi:preprotein translocase subunit SecD
MKWRNAVILLLLAIIVSGTAYAYVRPIHLPGRDKPLLARPLLQGMQLGLDLRGGTYIVFEAVDTPERPLTAAKVREVRNIIEERINRLGLTEPVIQLLGENRIIVQLPGVSNPEEALAVIGKMAKLEFRDETGVVIQENAIAPDLTVPPLLTGANLQESSAMITELPTGEISNVVSLDFDSEGTAKFADATTKLADGNRPIFIFLDDQLIQVAYVREPITGGKGVIEGFGSLEEAMAIEIMLDSGSLPVDVEQREMRFVSATLGQDQIDKSIRAGFIGIAFVVLFMLFFYRLPGLVADFALLVYVLLVLGILMGLNAVLTLPGVAGIILSVGMTVDANVIIFERIKEEVRLGKTVRASIDSGFRKAFQTILDSNITTLIAAGVLFYFGTGPIRGFAVTLAIGILASMFTAITITRLVLRLTVNLFPTSNSKFLVGA